MVTLPHHSERRAFTLIEIIIVVTILGLITGAIAMRFTGQERREAVVAVDDTADLFSLFAHRHSMGEEKIAIGYDPEAGVIMLLELRGDPSDRLNPPRWDISASHLQVQLPEGISVIAARQDGREISSAMPDWFIPVVPGSGRPTIEIDLYSEPLDATYTIYLPAFEINAKVIGSGLDRGTYRVPIDLDAAGRDREVW